MCYKNYSLMFVRYMAKYMSILDNKLFSYMSLE